MSPRRMPNHFERSEVFAMVEAATEISGASLVRRPAAPVPHSKNLSTLAFILELGKNPIAAFGTRAYREHYVYERSRLTP